MPYHFFIHGGLAAAAFSSAERRLDGPLSEPAEDGSTCKCGGSVPWTAESALPARAIGAINTGQGQPSGLFGKSCTTQGSTTGQAWCFLGTVANVCSDEVRDSGDTALNLWDTSGWYYSYKACEGHPTDGATRNSLRSSTVTLAVIVANAYLRHAV